MNKIFIIICLFLACITCNAEIIQDEVANKLIRIHPTPETYTDYDFESTVKIPIKLKVTENIRTENELYENQKVKFKVVKDVLYQNKVILQRGSIVPARVSVIITPGMNGIPASIILSDFEINNIKNSQLTSSYEINGQDRSLLVFPLKWALTILPPTGSLTNFIMGGHAKIKVKKPITIYYYPEWK